MLHWVPEVGGLLAFVAAPPDLRDYAPGVYNLGRHAHRGMDYVELRFHATSKRAWSSDDLRARLTGIVRLLMRDVPRG
ncbi:hypothetical protein AB0H83_12380 [Dactylosporangium sp. NPDC050688]|uniref:hypothetical protein n=1 Tax=Dactylosporangium sp. NPDC050688 TaxID=3157217 RepID=UPI0034012622